eukprot:6487740-Amphidinium_carterae.1
MFHKPSVTIYHMCCRGREGTDMGTPSSRNPSLCNVMLGQTQVLRKNKARTQAIRESSSRTVCSQFPVRPVSDFFKGQQCHGGSSDSCKQELNLKRPMLLCSTVKLKWVRKLANWHESPESSWAPCTLIDKSDRPHPCRVAGKWTNAHQ